VQPAETKKACGGYPRNPLTAEEKITENKALIIAKIKELNLKVDVVNAFFERVEKDG